MATFSTTKFIGNIEHMRRLWNSPSSSAVSIAAISSRDPRGRRRPPGSVSSLSSFHSGSNSCSNSDMRSVWFLSSFKSVRTPASIFRTAFWKPSTEKMLIKSQKIYNFKFLIWLNRFYFCLKPTEVLSSSLTVFSSC